ncbi:hypothetical protein AK812_SmicGene44474 [Symbiodinium microadriaticum]|uniref:Uncharacterized protein n=1 Tax=Symbiodinium microadriaticum TaxID=2951 RepID=A0A1Q9BYF9_SYMMI|nr:hypothetical protein AK812_SmicGene44474 [Symbiodinium microadriaticum]
MGFQLAGNPSHLFSTNARLAAFGNEYLGFGRRRLFLESPNATSERGSEVSVPAVPSALSKSEDLALLMDDEASNVDLNQTQHGEL